MVSAGLEVGGVVAAAVWMIGGTEAVPILLPVTVVAVWEGSGLTNGTERFSVLVVGACGDTGVVDTADRSSEARGGSGLVKQEEQLQRWRRKGWGLFCCSRCDFREEDSSFHLQVARVCQMPRRLGYCHLYQPSGVGHN